MSEWQPIETAPKDGSEILSWDSRLGQYKLIWHVREKNKEGFSSGFERCGGYDIGEIWENPTHWMPLPKSPEDA